MTLRVLSNRKNHELCARDVFLFHHIYVCPYVYPCNQHMYAYCCLSSEQMKEIMEMIVNFIY